MTSSSSSSSSSQTGDGSIVRLALKGGSVLLNSKCERGIQWSNLTGEFLFNIIINRSSLDNPFICIYAGSPPSQVVYDSIKEKKNYIYILDASNPDIGLSNIDAMLKTYLSNGSGIYKSYSIMIFGYSDLIIRNGLNNSISFIKQCLLYKNALPNMNIIKESIIDKEENFGRVFAIVQENLHSFNNIEILKQNFTSIINSGPSLLSLDGNNINSFDNRSAVADINIIRKSPNTGKILEEEEIFGYDNVNYRLYPLSIVKDNQIVEDIKTKTIQDSLLKLQLAGPNKQINHHKNDRHELKITFNSTDPEWDDDPNPDDDLDL
jgi:hypothetical protein